jgi:hypothetical protein
VAEAVRTLPSKHETLSSNTSAAKKKKKKRKKEKKRILPAARWLMPIILATQEAEIRRIAVRSQPGQIVP